MDRGVQRRFRNLLLCGAITLALGFPMAAADAAPSDPPSGPTTASPSAPESASGTPGQTPKPSTTPEPSDSPSPTPTAEPTAEPTAAESSDRPTTRPPSRTVDPSPSGSASDPSPSDPGSDSPSPSGSASATPDGRENERPAPRAASAVSLKVAAKNTPVSGRFFQDIGSYGFSGSISPAQSGQRVEIWYVAASGSWKRILATKTDANGRYSISKPVTVAGKRKFAATLGGSPASSSTVHSSTVTVTVEDMKIKVTPLSPKRFDSLKNPTIRGTVFPARANVVVHFRVKSGKAFHEKATTRTNSKGQWSVKFTTGKGKLQRYELQARNWVSRSSRWETSNTTPIRRIAVLNPSWRQTTAADVAKTYRSGCPVGPSKLNTISMNYYGFDKRMHRGVIIVKKGITKKVVRSFRAALDARYPIRRMDNPNVWNGDDPKMMAADNTSAFNCRKVTGNPYSQSPHSYGIALDVNTVRNPYRDAAGKWWPENGRKYIKRTPWKPGMLTKSSVLTKNLRSRGFFWGGFWSPGKDYQHYEDQ